MSEITTAVAAAVEEQDAATREIASNVQQASSATEEVSSNISGVTQAASDTGAASVQILGKTEGLAEQSTLLSTEVDKFLNEIRSS